MIPPLKPYNQLLNHEDRKGKDSGSFSSSYSLVETDSGIYKDEKGVRGHEILYIYRNERIREGYLKYHIGGFRGAYDKSMTVEIRNSRQFVLVVSGRTYKSDGRSVVIERHITLPNNDYSEAIKRATFHSNMGLLVVEISDFKEAEDIKIEVEEKKV
ncbi:hypothetical protein Tco_0810483 [Tanacetum coccineum]